MYKVIIVEDELMTRKGLIQTIPWSEHGCEVVGEASDGQEGIRLAMQANPDIVITDIHMPIVDGLTMIQRIKTHLDCEFIIFSGYGQFSYAQKALALGARGYLLKPVDDDEFLQILDDTIQAIQQKRRFHKLMEQMEVPDAKVPSFLEKYLAKDPTSCGERYLVDAIRYIRSHYGEDLTGKTVAASLGISESYLGKLFRQQMGYTFLEYLTMHRIYVALDLLSQTDLKTYHIAEMVGYKDARHFSDIFKKLVGVTPTQYRNR